MIQSAPHRRITLTLAAVVLAIAGFAGLPPSAAYAAGTWKAQTSDTTRSLTGGGGLYSVTFVDRVHGWAAGERGGILVTTDGGAHWTAHNEAYSYRHAGLFFADATHGWAAKGHISATSDGGATWTAQTSGASDDFYAITFVDADHGWAVGGTGAYVIAATTDGGATWTEQMNVAIGGDYSSIGPNHPGLNSVAFSDAEHGWAVGYNGAIFATSDGGATWTAQTSGTKAGIQCVSFADSTHGWAVGGGGFMSNAPVILATSDGGATWTAQDASGAGSDALLSSVAFTDTTHGWAVGSAYDSGNHVTNGVILATSDGGTTWTAQKSGTKDGLNSVSFVDETHGWAVGDNGTVLVYNTAPAPASAASSTGAAVWIIAAVIIALVIIGGLIVFFRARRRKVTSVALAADPPVPDSRGPIGDTGQPGAALDSGEKAQYCAGCGSPVRADSAYCTSCGAKAIR